MQKPILMLEITERVFLHLFYPNHLITLLKTQYKTQRLLGMETR
jgi:hypothetical protein